MRAVPCSTLPRLASSQRLVASLLVGAALFACAGDSGPPLPSRVPDAAVAPPPSAPAQKGTLPPSQTEGEVRMIAAQYDDAIFLGSPLRQPGCPQLNMTTMTGYPQYGYQGIRNMARLMASSMEHAARPRSTLFRRVLYG